MEEPVRRRPLIAGRERGPGPGRYALPPTVGYINHDVTKPSSPAYTLHGRLSSAMVSVDSSPGPRYLVDPGLTRFGRVRSLSYSMLGRGKRAGELFQTPGPGAYSPEKAPPLNSHRRPPVFTMSTRTRYRTVDPVPAPNRSPPSRPVPATASQAGSERGNPPRTCPGPPGRAATAAPTPMCTCAASLPSPWGAGSGGPWGPRTPTRAPGTHSPEKWQAHLPRPPSFTLGQRHSEFVTPLVVLVVDPVD
ncbi:hypothetical protein NHX12_019991 [Muraenolepis orangiensis]|uniref:Outer dense fiber protein 3-like protein 2 n=1 Tax=Muraenolepis orangiensis TaxID=630683 RepID=A0A9Q0EXQ8_9TELE|nr:hypothetical protein NHX12_019991 [Muraenolepis orangiensis]